MSTKPVVEEEVPVVSATGGAPVAAAEPEADLEFANAFADFAEPGEPPVAAAPSAATPAVAEPAAEPAATPVEEPAAEAPAGPDSTPSFAEELAKLRSELIKPVAEPEPEPAPASAAVDPAPAPSAMDPKDAEFLAAYEKDWPDISKAESIKRRVEMQQVVQYVFAEVAKAYAPLVEYFNDTSYNGHYNAIVDKHEDYDQIRDEVIKWTKEQSPARRKAFTEVIQSGTAEEVSDLIDVWKEVTGKKKPAEPQVQDPPAATPDKAKQAAQRLSVVSSKRTVIPAAADPNDFDGAFAEFAKK